MEVKDAGPKKIDSREGRQNETRKFNLEQPKAVRSVKILNKFCCLS